MIDPDCLICGNPQGTHICSRCQLVLQARNLAQGKSASYDSTEEARSEACDSFESDTWKPWKSGIFALSCEYKKILIELACQVEDIAGRIAGVPLNFPARRALEKAAATLRHVGSL